MHFWGETGVESGTNPSTSPSQAPGTLRMPLGIPDMRIFSIRESNEYRSTAGNYQ